MKNKLLKVLLLGSTLTMALAGCGEQPTPEPTPEPTQQPTVEPTPEPTPEPTEEPTEAPKPDEHPAIVELNRYVYVEGEDAYGDLTRFDVWSKALKDYKSRLTSASVTMPEECPNGEAYITITSGRDSVQQKIYYYKDAETAAKLHKVNMPEDTSKLFNEAKYINSKTGKLAFTAAEYDGNIYAEADAVNAVYMNTTGHASWNTDRLSLWSDVTAMEKCHYDESKVTVPHYVEVDEDGNAIKDHYNVSYYPESDSVDPSSIIDYEIIVDGQGRVAYMAPIKYLESSQISIVSEEGYWSYYKDYTKNPAIVLAPDFNAETNPMAYQKVLPEGGMWIVAFHQSYNKPGSIDGIWKAMSGTTSSMYNASQGFKLTLEEPEIETALMNTRLMHKSRKISVLRTANSYELYAYYYSKAIKSGDQTLLAKRDEIYEAIIKQQLPEIKNEPVLFKYYEQGTIEKITAWGEMFKTSEESK